MGQSPVYALTESEYRLVSLLRALGDVKRFTLIRILRDGSRWTEYLSQILSISRPGLTKHLRVLKDNGLIVENYVIENGKAKARCEITELGEKVATVIDEELHDIIKGERKALKSLKAELAEVEIQHSSVTSILDKLEEKLKRGLINKEEYESLRKDYLRQEGRLKGKIERLKVKVEVV